MLFEDKKINKLSDFFSQIEQRENKSVYFYRLVGFSQESEIFLKNYYKEVRRCGIYIKEKLRNPIGTQVSSIEDIIGTDFVLSEDFFSMIFSRLLPRLNQQQNKRISSAMFVILEEMKKNGKNNNILRNAYVRFLCWIYYKFQTVITKTGENLIPKILFEGNISSYELYILRILSYIGCDIIIVQYNGDDDYLKLDKISEYTNKLEFQNKGVPPEHFSRIELSESNLEKPDKTPLPKMESSLFVSTNTWLSGDCFEDCLKSPQSRGGSRDFIYNMFVKISGAEDLAQYENQLVKWKMKLESSKRNIVIIERIIPMPTVDEVQKIKRRNYKQGKEILLDLSKMDFYIKNKELNTLIKKALLEVMQDNPTATLQEMTNGMICLVCWINRYINQVIPFWDKNNIGVFIYYGVCENKNEVLFMKLLSKLPIDVFVISPDLSMKCKLTAKNLYEKIYENSVDSTSFPKEKPVLEIGTVAYHAEQTLNTVMYQDTGLYRNKQFKDTIPVRLKTMYEEIEILWKEEAKYRPNFEVFDDRVMMPIIFAKVSGVKDGDVNNYWRSIKKLITKDTLLISTLPHITGNSTNKIKPYVASFFTNGTLDKNKIKNHHSYQYSYLSDDMQHYLLEKIQQLIGLKWINGGNTLGIEYAILSVALNMDKQTIRMIQKYDFTKQIPKVIVVSTKEDIGSLEDHIFLALLSLVGFDILIFTPTGYQTIGRFFNEKLFEEYQNGEYLYDMNVPNFGEISDNTVNNREGIASMFFRRGRK